MTICPYLRRKLSSTPGKLSTTGAAAPPSFRPATFCGQLILIGDAWDESHDPEGPPRCFGGTETGVAHRACNRRHGAEVVRPLDAKASRNRQKHIGSFQTRCKLPGGRKDWRKRRLDGSVLIRH
jgi:hypothetical protein